MNNASKFALPLASLVVGGVLAVGGYMIGTMQTPPAAPAPAPQVAAAEVDRGTVENIVREYLLGNPELMLEVQDALEARQQAEQQARQAETLAAKKELIYNSPNQMIIGDPNAKTTVVEFFDYNCGFCKRAHADMQRIVEENPNVKFIMKEFPVLGEASVAAHHVSLAVIRLYPEIYTEFHDKLLGSDQRKDGALAMQIAVSLGADPAKLEVEAKSPSNNDAIREVYELADGLGITGTPSYVLGNEIVFGAVGFDRLMPKIAGLVQCGKTVC
jgi:protein-disulfide isomerase